MRALLLLSLAAALAAGRYVDREKRDIEYHEWLTDAQKAELKQIKESADAASLKKRTMELYELLPSEEKQKWNGKYKEMCVAWIKEIATDEEKANYKQWKEEGKMEEITKQYKELKGRLTKEKRDDVELWETECWNLWKDEFPKSRGRRNVLELAEQKLSFLGEAKLSELKQLKESGASDDVIRDKVVTWTLEHWKAKDQGASTGDFVTKCYGWIKDVTTAAEYEAFEKLHHTDHEACRVKVREFLTRLDAAKKAVVEKSLPLCDAIWYKQHQEEHGSHDHHDHKAHKHHVARRHLHTSHIEEYMYWLSPEQKAEIEKLEEGGESYENLVAKMKTWYEEKPKEERKKIRSTIRRKCVGWVNQYTNLQERHVIMDAIGDADMDALIDALKVPYERLSEDEKHAVEHTKAVCMQIWTTEPESRRRRDHGHDEEYKQYMTWLTPEQGAELKALKESGKEDDIMDKVDGYYAALTGDKKTEATEKLKGACKHFFSKTFGDSAVAEFKQMKESGASMDDVAKKVEELINKITDEKKKSVATRASLNCKKIFSAARKRRDHDHHEEYKEYFSWLTPEQGAEIKALREAGDPEAVYKKVEEYYAALSGDKKTEATEKLKGGCKHFFHKSFGDAAVAEFKQMKDSGASMDEMSKKVEELVSKITDEKKKAVATRAAANCKKVFSTSRRRRDHSEDEEYKQYFSWLTPEQGAELKALRDAGNNEAIYEKIEGYLAALSGDKKAAAAEQVKGGCKHFFMKSFGDAAMAELKQMKDSGASIDDMGKKVEELISKISDEKKKAVAARASANCKKVFAASRRRRDHHEEYKEYFSWLTPEQGLEVKALRDAGKHDDVYKKIEEFYDELTGEKKAEATEKLKGGCKHFFHKSFGDAAVAEFKQLKDSGASHAELSKKADELVSKITDEKKKAVATRATANCKKIFSTSRRRRDHAEAEEYKQYMTWMTEEQQAELKALKDAGKDNELFDRADEFYSALSGDKKAEATEKQKGACKHFFTKTFGDAAVAEFKQLKDSGASMEEIGKKVEELISKITDEKKKALATRASANCKKIFSASRKRRDHHEEYQQYFTWLTPEQGAELKKVGITGDHDAFYKKVDEFFTGLDADKKLEATEKLKGACKHFFSATFGDAAVAEVKQMKESGSSVDEIEKKVGELIDKLDDDKKKTTAQRATANCKKFFAPAVRARRNEGHKHTLVEAFTEFLPWITEEQKMEIKNMDESGAEDKIGAKVIEYFNALDADKKEEARGKLQAGCRHYFKGLLGDAVAGEFKQLRESGATPAEMVTKLEEIIDKVDNAEKKAKARELAKNCKVVYGVASRKRRDHHEHNLEEAFTEFLPWLSEEQKMEVKNMKESGAEAKIGEKIMEFYNSVDPSKKDEARTKLQGACRHYLKDLLGDGAAAEFKQLRESGASPADMAKRLDEVIGKMEEGAKKSKAQELSKNCKKIYGVESRRRRHLYDEYDERYQKYYSWLSDDQKTEMEELREKGDSDALLEKVSKYFSELEEAKKQEARDQLKMGCRVRMSDLIGEERAGEIKKMKEEGATKSEMLEKVSQFVEAMDEGSEKESARRSYKHCAKILSRSRRDVVSLADHFTWLSADQRDQLNILIRTNPDALYDKLFEFLGQLEGKPRAEADAQMKNACGLFIASFVGEGQALKLRGMNQAKKPWNDIVHTLDGMINGIEVDVVRARAKVAIGHCKQFWDPKMQKQMAPVTIPKSEAAAPAAAAAAAKPAAKTA